MDCARSNRSTTSRQQQELLAEHFTKLGAQVGFQEFDTPHPKKGTPVRMKNLIVSWHPQAKERVLLCCHYDTRPFPDRDQFRPKGTFVGANDGGSGVALFMEMGHSLPAIQPTFGVDMIGDKRLTIPIEPLSQKFAPKVTAASGRLRER